MSTSPAKTSHAPEPTAELRQRFHAGEPDAVDALAVAFYEDILRLATAILGNPDWAADAVQETFLRVVERHRQYRPERPFRPWIIAVCRNCCLAYWREANRRQARIVDLDPTDEEVARMPAGLPTAFEAMLREEREAEALAALGALPEANRTIAVLHLFEDMTFREIAELLGRPPNTVATIYYRTLAELRQRLQHPETPRSRPHAS